VGNRDRRDLGGREPHQIREGLKPPALRTLTSLSALADMPMSVRSISVRRTGQLRVRVNTTASNEGSGLMSLQWYRWPPVTTSLIMPLV
jgi:hypothetical protein